MSSRSGRAPAMPAVASGLVVTPGRVQCHAPRVDRRSNHQVLGIDLHLTGGLDVEIPEPEETPLPTEHLAQNLNHLMVKYLLQVGLRHRFHFHQDFAEPFLLSGAMLQQQGLLELESLHHPETEGDAAEGLADGTRGGVDDLPRTKDDQTLLGTRREREFSRLLGHRQKMENLRRLDVLQLACKSHPGILLPPSPAAADPARAAARVISTEVVFNPNPD